MTNEARETTFVCGDCLAQVVNFEGNADSMKNLPGYWDYIGHGWEEDDIAECDECSAGDFYSCEKVDGESSPRWECPGCDVTGIMCNEMYLIEKFD